MGVRHRPSHVPTPGFYSLVAPGRPWRVTGECHAGVPPRVSKRPRAPAGRRTRWGTWTASPPICRGQTTREPLHESASSGLPSSADSCRTPCRRSRPRVPQSSFGLTAHSDSSIATPKSLGPSGTSNTIAAPGHPPSRQVPTRTAARTSPRLTLARSGVRAIEATQPPAHFATVTLLLGQRQSGWPLSSITKPPFRPRAGPY